MKKILEKSGNFVRGKKWEPWTTFMQMRSRTQQQYAPSINKKAAILNPLLTMESRKFGTKGNTRCAD